MAMSWDNVELIRNAQASAKKRFEATALATQDEIKKALESETAKALTLPRLTEIEQMIFKLRAELIDYIVAHGLVDGMIWNGQLQPVENGKIIITADMIDAVIKFLGYFQESDVQAFLEKYLPANDYVQDSDYVHTDNNYTNEAAEKLAGIENGAEVNKVINVIFNGKKVLDDGTRVATITVTPEDIKNWYEENPNTNVFTDVEKTKLAGISDGADVNRVDDVIVNRQSVMNDQKQAVISKELIRDTYEANDGIVRFDTEKDSMLKHTNIQSNTNAEDISNLSKELTDAKDSISELGDEVNTVAGRVTSLELRGMTYVTRMAFDPYSMLTSDMAGAGIFEFVFTVSCTVGDVDKSFDVKFVGAATVRTDGASISLANADMDCVSEAFTDETGVFAKFVGFYRATGTASQATAWLRTADVRVVNATVKSVSKLVSLAEPEPGVSIDDADNISVEITLNGDLKFDVADYSFDDSKFYPTTGETKTFANEKIKIAMQRSSAVTFTGSMYMYNIGSYSYAMPISVTYYYKANKLEFDPEYARGVAQVYGTAKNTAKCDVISMSKN